MNPASENSPASSQRARPDASGLVLRLPRVQDEVSFRAAVKAFREEGGGFDFAFSFNDSMDFHAYVKMVEAWTHGAQLARGHVPHTFLVGVVGGTIVGRLSVRHRLNEHLFQIGGHIGYGVIPSQRRRGYASAMLRQSLPLCASLGIEKALVTCDITNIGSAMVIEACGGVFEGITDLPELTVQKRRYWIDTAPAP